jgi:hypothetical protein
VARKSRDNICHRKWRLIARMFINGMNTQKEKQLPTRFLQALPAGRRAAIVMLTLVAVLIITWTLPHVIALRNILLYTLFIWLILAQRFDSKWRSADSILLLPSLGLAALTVWLFVVAIWVDSNPARTLDGIKGEWLPAIVAFTIGGLLVPTLSRRGIEPRYVMRAVFGALIVLSVAQLTVAIWYVLWGGGLPGFFRGISDHKTNITYATAIGLSMLLADVMAQRTKSGLLGLSRWMQLGTFAILVATTYVSGARNGIVIALVLIIFWAFLFGINNLSFLSRRTKLLMVLGIGLCISVAAWAMIKVDDRWSRLIVTVPVAWDVDGDQSWLDPYERGMPIAEDGQPVEETAYLRIAFARVAVKLIAEFPLGIGLSKSTFKELVEKEYGKTIAAHSHNGYLDFALAVGVPGVVIWVSFLILLLRAGMVSFKAGTVSSVALLLLVVGFALRSGLDSTLRDHILEEFLFISGLFLSVADVSDEGRQS